MDGHVHVPSLPLSNVSPELQQVFDNILKYRVDATGEYYGITLDVLLAQLKELSTECVAAVVDDSTCEPMEKDFKYDIILQNFVQGAGGRISTWSKEQHTNIPVVLRGVTKYKQMNACRAAGRDFYYIDTGYFGNGKRKLYHRITKNDLQCFGPIIDRPSDRLQQTGVRLSKFRRTGSKILLAPPSQKLLNLYNINLEQWLDQTKTEIHKHTDREIVVRLKQGRTVRQSTDTMEMALDDDVFCLVTFSSIAAGEALLHGKPAITLGPNAAAPLCSQSLTEIENPKIPSLDEVDAWARHLAYCQFTEVEMQNGIAWRILNDS